ncbi:MAG: hypothetical protein V4665_01020 [Patescibacteria group bacterium]
MKQAILIIAIASLLSCTSDIPQTTPEPGAVSSIKLQFEDNTVDYSTDESFRKFKVGDKLTVQRSSDGYSSSEWEVSSSPIVRDTVTWAPYLKTFPEASIYAGHTYREERAYRKAVIVKN